MSDRERQTLHESTYMWNLNKQMNKHNKNRNRVINTEKKQLLLGRRVGGGDTYLGAIFLSVYRELPYDFFLLSTMLGLSRDMQDLVPSPGIKPGLSALRVQSLNHWTTREVSPFDLLQLQSIPLQQSLIIYLSAIY